MIRARLPACPRCRTREFVRQVVDLSVEVRHHTRVRVLGFLKTHDTGVEPSDCPIERHASGRRRGIMFRKFLIVSRRRISQPRFRLRDLTFEGPDRLA